MTYRGKMLVAGAAIAAALAAAPVQAQFVDPWGRPVFRPDLPPPPYGGGYGPPRYVEPRGGYGPISCGEGAQIIASQGFRNISVRECSGRVFRYTAFRRGQPFEIRVSSRTGEITLVRPI